MSCIRLNYVLNTALIRLPQLALRLIRIKFEIPYARTSALDEQVPQCLLATISPSEVLAPYLEHSCAQVDYMTYVFEWIYRFI